MNHDPIKYALAKQLDRATAIRTDYGDIELDEVTQEAVENALRPILEKRLRDRLVIDRAIFMRDILWLWAITKLPEGLLLPRRFLVLRAILHPVEALRTWVENRNEQRNWKWAITKLPKRNR